jgi:hypothetical protein
MSCFLPIRYDKLIYIKLCTFTNNTAVAHVFSPFTLLRIKTFSSSAKTIHILIMLTGWWGMYEATEVAFSPLAGAADMAWNTLVGWIFIPFEAYHALKVSTCYLLP